MIKIKSIINELKKYNEITDYSIIEKQVKTVEQFYDLQKLETTRKTNTDEISVNIYTAINENGNKYLGNASFIVSHRISMIALNELIKDAIYQASFVKNAYYEIPSGEGKKVYRQRNEDKDAFEILQDIANIFFTERSKYCKFNSLECFYNNVTTHLVNSRGVDYKKTTHNVQVEAIPSFRDSDKSRKYATELYRMFTYDDLKDYDKIKEDARNAIYDVLNRSCARKFDKSLKTNIILKGEHISQMIFELISTYNYASVYKHVNFNNIGDKIQDNPTTLLNISLVPANKADFFDADGVLLKDTAIIKDGELKEYYGNNRFAYYLNLKPTGNMNTIKMPRGVTTYETMKNKPYIEILDMSGIQVDLFGDYIGGEVRLANYFDGKNTYPITAFSFSGSLKNCINNLKLSKDLIAIPHYKGPNYALLKDLDVL